MSETYRRTKTEKFFRTTKSGCRIKITKTEVKYSIRVPKNIDIGEFIHMQTYNDMYSSFTYNDMVTFNEIPCPIGVGIKSTSIYPQLEVVGYGPTHHLAMRDTFEQLIKIVTDARRSQKNAENWSGLL